MVCALVAALPVVPSALHASHVCSTSRTRSGLDADIRRPRPAQRGVAAARSCPAPPLSDEQRYPHDLPREPRAATRCRGHASAYPPSRTPLTPGGSALECDSSLAPASAYSHDAAAATPLRIADLQLRLIDFAVRRSQIVCASQLVRIATGTVYGTMSTSTCRDRAG